MTENKATAQWELANKTQAAYEQQTERTAIAIDKLNNTEGRASVTTRQNRLQGEIIQCGQTNNSRMGRG